MTQKTVAKQEPKTKTKKPHELSADERKDPASYGSPLKLAKSPKVVTKYVAGVVIDGQIWTEKSDGNLMGTMTHNCNDAKLWSTRDAANNRAELIASRFRKSAKARPFTNSIRK